MTDRIVNLYKHGASIKECSRATGLSHGKIRKILITDGLYTSQREQEIARMTAQGLTDAEIMAELNIGKSALNAHRPYCKGEYNGDTPTANAVRIKKHRGQKEKELY